jgi:hypothetical protein
MRFSPSAILAVAAAAACSSLSFAQCTPHWDTTPGTPGNADGYVGAFFNYQGALVASGSFSGMAGVPGTNLLASYDRATNTWSSIGGGLHLGSSNGFGTSFAQFGTDLIIGGFFHDAATLPDTKSIVRWDGTAYHSMVTGWNPDGVNSVWSLCSTSQFGGPKVFFGGGFDSVNGQPAANVGVWDGTTATPFVTSMTLTGFNALVTQMLVFDDGQGGGPQLYIAGRFADVNGVAAKMLARWNGTTWSAVGTNMGNTIVTGEIDAMIAWNGALYIGGSNIRVNGALQQTAKWDGLTWTAVGQNPTGRVWSLAVFNDGSGEKLYAGGTQPALARFFRLEGNTWVTAGGGADNSVFKLLNDSGKLYVGGSFANVNATTPVHGVAVRIGCQVCGTADFNCDGDLGTDSDIASFFACLAGACPAAPCTATADFNGDGDLGTDADIEAFFRVLGGGSC